MGWLTGDSPQDIKRNVVDPQLRAAQAKHDEYTNMLRQLVGGSGYNFFAPRTTTQDQRSVSNVDRTTAPVLNPEFRGMVDALKSVIGDRLTSGSSLPPGYAESQVRAINAAAAPGRQAIQNLAARTGRNAEQLSIGSPVERQVAGQLADLAANLPLRERAMQTEDLGLASALAQVFGLGQRVTGTESMFGSGSSTSPADIAQFLQYLSMLAPYDAPIVVPQGRSGVLGDVVQAGARFIPGGGGS